MSISHRHIEVFRAVMTSGSVTAAAALLHTSQPTVSRELARLEQMLGFVLFDRIKGRLQPTAPALALFDEVQRSYIGLERIVETAANLARPDGGQLAVACLPAFAHALLPAVCRRLQQQAGNVRVAITPQESPLLEEWLSAQRFDIGLTESAEPPPGTSLQPLLSADEVCVLPEGHPLLAKAVLAPQDFAGQPFVSLSPQDAYRLQLDAVFAAAGVARQLVWETHSAVSVCALVQQGLGVAIVNPLTALAMAGQGMQLRRFAVSVPFAVSVVLPQFRPSTPLSGTFVALLQQEAALLQQRLAAI
ncbi:LysR family transcriptional regulator [Vogesella oryzae]|uniref:LysR family transcriptional regulator n=1 Tax=Vogesella oryzae TaxID=1735285 RepID=UPI001581EE58|nr:LysR family transcriptional regulator [Vogesella oryzae]